METGVIKEKMEESIAKRGAFLVMGEKMSKKNNKRQKKKNGASVQELLGIKAFTEYGIQTNRGELLFFKVKPTNISVLSPSSVEAKIRQLTLVLSAVPDVEISCTDSAECFDENKAYLIGRAEEEKNEKVRSLIRRDISFLDEIQAEMATARQFLFIARCRNMKSQQVFARANQIQKAIFEQGFDVRRMDKGEIKRLQDVIELLANIRKNRECLLHCSVFIELKAPSLALLKELQSEVMMDLARSKISADRLTLRQKEGFLSVQPAGANQFGARFERVLPASSAANFYPFSFSGKTDPHGLYIGRDKFGTNILTDFDRRAEDKTTSNILILGNSGQGKSYLLKLILTNIRESGKRVICLDPESEYGDLCAALGGSYVDFLSGENTINPLEPKTWTDTADDDPSAPEAFRKTTRLSQHIAFLKDFFRSYKDFDDAQIDTIEILLSKLYEKFGITEETDYAALTSADYPIMEDFYRLCEEEYRSYDRKEKQLYTEETLQTVCLGIHSMCVGAESKYFNGHTNIGVGDFVCFGVKGLMDTNKRLKDAMLFNILSYMSDRLLGEGNTAASVDELYLFLTNMTAIEYIRNAMKRVRKKDSSLILASQNIEDFLLPSVRKYTKPLFSIPTHQFLFNAGQVNPREYMDALQVEPSEFERIKYPERGTCLYRCGNERYLLQVIAPAYKSAMFGAAGGR